MSVDVEKPVPPHGVPTLTEVVAWPGMLPLSALAEAPAVAARARMPTDDELTRRIVSDLQRQVDLMLDYRLREALAPLLARAADSLIRDARQELASTLRDMVARAVAKELARHRDR